VLFGHPIWNPILLIGAFHQPVVAFVALIAILICNAQREHRGQRGLTVE